MIFHLFFILVKRLHFIKVITGRRELWLNRSWDWWIISEMSSASSCRLESLIMLLQNVSICYILCVNLGAKKLLVAWSIVQGVKKVNYLFISHQNLQKYVKWFCKFFQKSSLAKIFLDLHTWHIIVFFEADKYYGRKHF